MIFNILFLFLIFCDIFLRLWKKPRGRVLWTLSLYPGLKLHKYSNCTPNMGSRKRICQQIIKIYIFFIFNIFWYFFKIMKAAGGESTMINLSLYPGLKLHKYSKRNWIYNSYLCFSMLIIHNFYQIWIHDNTRQPRKVILGMQP
jgi:hypothetical protein